MAIDYHAFMAKSDNDRRFEYSELHTLLYALSVGMGRDPVSPEELPFVFEGAELKAIPSMASVTSRSNFVRNLPIDMTKMLHGEQRLTVYRPLPVEASLLADTRITKVIDKGEGKGALIYYETSARTAEDNEPLYTVGATLFARGDGGFGGPAGPVDPPHTIPDREPDFAHECQTRPDQALLYRLNGDRNPLHADPKLAERAGFPAPILHGLCTYGIACQSVLAKAANYDVSRMRTFNARFTSAAFPGDRIRTEIWVDGETVSFRCRVPDRDVVVINNGLSLIEPAGRSKTSSKGAELRDTFRAMNETEG